MYQIPLAKPYITDETKARVCQVLESGMLSEGDVTREFEEACRAYIGSRYAIAVTSCTTGLEVALRALTIGPGDEVIIPDFTYPATAQAVRIVGATAVIVDVNPETMLIDYDAIEGAITERTRAIMPVSLFGNPLNYEILDSIKANSGVAIVEDAACAFGSTYRNQKVGTCADISVFSFHPRKFVTTGEGGIISTDNEEWANWMKSYKAFGYNTNNGKGAVAFGAAGTNYKLSNVLAAIGLAQLNCIEELQSRRLRRVHNYRELISNNTQIRLPQTTLNGEHSYQSFCVFIPNRDGVLKAVRDQGIEVQIGTYALHSLPAFHEDSGYRFVGELKGSRAAFESCLALPLYDDLSYDDQIIIIKAVNDALEKGS